MNTEKIMDKESVIDKQVLLRRLLERPTFPWPDVPCTTIGALISTSSQLEAAAQINTLDKEISLSPAEVIAKVEPRASSWQFQELLAPYKAYTEFSLGYFLSIVGEEQEKRIKIARENPKLEEETDSLLINQQWVAKTLAYEIRAAIKRKSQAEQEKDKLAKEVLGFKVKVLKQSPDGQYGDMFNKLVCERLDVLEKSGEIPTGANKLKYAESLIKNEIEAGINDQEIKEFLEQKLREQKVKRLLNLIQKGTAQFGDSEKVISFAAMMFEIDQKKTDATWQERKFEETIINGLKGQPVTLISILCCINQFNFNGGYTLVPDLFAYQNNPKLEPIPLIVNEIMLVARFFEFYDIKTNLIIYVADTDYTEIGQFGEVIPSNLKNLRDYLSNLEKYLSSNKEGDVEILPISALTDNNSLYNQVKARILENVTKFKDQDFTREWYQKFEEAVERVSESQIKRRFLTPKQARGKSLEITRKIWAVNAAQGVIFGTLGPNTILLSTERRARDQNYIIDKATRANFPPVIYLLKAAEVWNRKLVGTLD